MSRIPGGLRRLSALGAAVTLLLGACAGSEPEAVVSSPTPPASVAPSPEPVLVVPNLAGITADEAVGVLERAGISYVVREEPGDAAPGAVHRTAPGGGTEISRADVVIVYVSSAPRPSPTVDAPSPTPKAAEPSTVVPEVAPLPEGIEPFLEAFALAWGSQDLAEMTRYAEADVVDTLSQTGVGEAAVFYESSCAMGSAANGGCDLLFLPADQTECCAQIWQISYVEDAPTIRIVNAEFAGDAG